MPNPGAMPNGDDTPAHAARLLLDARRTGVTIAHLPERLRPLSQMEAHRIQDAIIHGLGGVGGWKIFAGDDPAPFLSPVPASMMFGQPHSAADRVLPIVLVELEVAVTLGRDLPAPDGPPDIETVRAAVASFHPLLELITLSWTDRNQVDRLTQLGDLQNSAGFVTGPALERWGDFDPAGARATLFLDEVEVANTPGGADIATILRTLAYLAEHAASRGMPLLAGQVITTGARLVVPTNTATEIRGEVAGLGQVFATLR